VSRVAVVVALLQLLAVVVDAAVGVGHRHSEAHLRSLLRAYARYC
jgi:hypothetical protein